MRLGWLEWVLMNNPVRRLAQRYFEARQLLHMGGQQSGAMALEIGCGAGAGIDLLYEDFRVEQVHAFDLDPTMVKLATARHQGGHLKPLLWVGNVRRIPVKDNVYDAIFDFGILHHVVDWSSALVEIHRVLKPGGRFYIEEIPRKVVVHPVWRKLLYHPQENRFEIHELVTAMEDTGFIVRRYRQWAGLFIWCVADKRG